MLILHFYIVFVLYLYFILYILYLYFILYFKMLSVSLSLMIINLLRLLELLFQFMIVLYV